MRVRDLVLSLFVVVGLIFFATNYARAQALSQSLSSNLQLRVYYNDITGNEALSFKTEGTHYLSDLTLNFNQQWGEAEDAIQVEALANFRATDDPQFQVRGDTYRLQNAYLTLDKRKAWKFTGGYFNERFTSYTMSTSLLGINTRFNLSESLVLKVFGGRDRKARSNEQLARYAGGTRLAYNLSSSDQIGLSYVRTWDRVSSLDEVNRGGVSDTVSNDVMSVDFEAYNELFNTRLEAEVAGSNYDTDTTSNQGEVEGEIARRVSMFSQIPRLGSIRLKYEEVDPNFQTVSGFATADRERYQGNWRNQFENVFGERWFFHASYEEWEDGLESTRTHKVTDWVYQMTYDPQFEGYFNSAADFTVEDREDLGTVAVDDSNESDRRIYSLTSDNRLGEKNVTLDYSYQNEKSDSETEGRFEATYESPFGFFGIGSRFLLDGIYEEQENDLGSDITVDRRYKVHNEITLGENARENIVLEQGYQEEDTDGSLPIVRTTFGLSFNYLFSRRTGNKISFSYFVNDNEDEGDPTQDYREETVDMRVDYSF